MNFQPFIHGAIAGAIATAPMTLLMQAWHRILPKQEQYALPPSEIMQKITTETGVAPQIDQQQHAALTLLGHFGYGAATGALYPTLARRVPLNPALSGILYALLVWSISYLGLLPAAGILKPATEHPAQRNALMIGAHIVWGTALGLVTKQLQQNR